MTSGTVAVVARDADSKSLGVAVLAALAGVGAYCPGARAGVGALSLQGEVAPQLRARLLDLLADGMGAEEALSRVWEADPSRERRQVALIDARGGAAAATGEGVEGHAGHLVGDGLVVAGGHLVAMDVLDRAKEAFEAAVTEDLPERLMRALEAAANAGGDQRGQRSAALLVVRHEGFPYADLRVDDDAEAVRALRRLLDHHAERFLPGYEAWVDALRQDG